MTNSAGDAAGKNHWNSVWNNLGPVQSYSGPVLEHHAVLAKFLASAGGGDAIEIGCVPGNLMVYLHKEFGYRVDGIDYCDKMDYVRANLVHNGIYDSQLFNTNLLDFRPSKRYDLVLSAGFVEHFDDYASVLLKHTELAKPGGLVVVWVPNLTHVHKLLCRLFAPEVLKVHRLGLMYRTNLHKALEAADLKVLHCDYHKTFRPTYKLPSPMDFVSRGVQKLLRTAGLDNIGNAFGSPYLISVSMKEST